MRCNSMVVGIAIGLLAGILFTKLNFSIILALGLGIWIGHYISNKKTRDYSFS
ncbi:putative membrane protein [[Clostridium] sordellii ATCC 9714]|nr:putative membrane protein [[Clostridium] sordellii ATCC 9714] [Paeniclostridium sordellii ATCC 9714]MDU1454899.1 hypothetical protein [Paeniclostridium sordellii]